MSQFMNFNYLYEQNLFGLKVLDINVVKEKQYLEELINQICLCFDLKNEDSLQLQIAKSLQTAIVSFDINGKPLHTSIKTTFNMVLVLKQEQNQKMARTYLNKILSTFYKRMAASMVSSLEFFFKYSNLLIINPATNYTYQIICCSQYGEFERNGKK